FPPHSAPMQNESAVDLMRPHSSILLSHSSAFVLSAHLRFWQPDNVVRSWSGIERNPLRHARTVLVTQMAINFHGPRETIVLGYLANLHSRDSCPCYQDGVDPFLTMSFGARFERCIAF